MHCILVSQFYNVNALQKQLSLAIRALDIMETEKNAFLINDKWKFPASLFTCCCVCETGVFSMLSHAPVLFWQIVCQFPGLNSRTDRARASGWGIYPSCSSGALQIPAILHAFASGSRCWHKDSDGFTPSNALNQDRTATKFSFCQHDIVIEPLSNRGLKQL